MEIFENFKLMVCGLWWKASENMKWITDLYCVQNGRKHKICDRFVSDTNNKYENISQYFLFGL
jgi:hypothetical protein